MRMILLMLCMSISSLAFAGMEKFLRVKNMGSYEADSTFIWSSEDKEYQLKGNGKLTLSVQGKPEKILKLSLFGFIGQLSILFRADDLYLLLENDYGGDGQSYVCSLKRDASSVNWCHKQGSFNMSAAYSSDSIWVSGIGLIARLNPKTGERVWARTSLYRQCADYGQDSFVAIWPTDETDKTITFDSRGSNYGSEWKLVVKKDSGRIVEARDALNRRVCPDIEK